MNTSRFNALIDAADYFAAFAGACRAAERQILILGWDFDRRERLHRADQASELPDELGAFLIELVKRKPRLNIYLLSWDFNMICAAERELLPARHMRLQAPPRFHFRLDDRFLRIGSSNTSNRSMGLDTECDLAIETSKRGDAMSRYIAGLRGQLLAEHLDCDADAVTNIRERGSLVAASRWPPRGAGRRSRNCCRRSKSAPTCSRWRRPRHGQRPPSAVSSSPAWRWFR
jgi:phosphatidylserine/phosphatidylglycerophosphate/cardiolipin synthase-like enzyme